MSNYLLEIGTEELPYKFITSAIDQLKKSFETLLKENEVSFDEIEVFGAPRRLTVVLKDIEDKQNP